MRVQFHISVKIVQVENLIIRWKIIIRLEIMDKIKDKILKFKKIDKR